MKSTLRRLVVASLWLIPVAVFAHPGHGKPTFPLGIAHPFAGADHLLAMLAVGLWAAQLGGRARWALPAAFVAAMTTGVLLGIAGFTLPAVEGVILGSVLLLGAAVAVATKLPASAAAALVALAGAAHGFAHGAELPAGGTVGAWLAGLVLATAALHAAGIAFGVLAERTSRAAWLRVAGGLIAGGGLVLAAVR